MATCISQFILAKPDILQNYLTHPCKFIYVLHLIPLFFWFVCWGFFLRSGFGNITYSSSWIPQSFHTFPPPRQDWKRRRSFHPILKTRSDQSKGIHSFFLKTRWRLQGKYDPWRKWSQNLIREIIHSLMWLEEQNT